MINVLCPAYFKTGGTELLHQLVFQLNQNNIEARMVYTDYEKYISNGVLNPAFSKYITDYMLEENLVDSSEDSIVVPEIACEYLSRYKSMKKYIWWLSVDNFIRECGLIGRIRVSGWMHGIGGSLIRLCKRKYHNLKNTIHLADMHLCQSKYANDFLIGKGVAASKIAYLSDYINDEYLDTYEANLKNKKEDIVLYNPKKGYKTTQKIIREGSDIRWVPLENLSNSQMKELLSTAKLYMDFGNHPGKDRIPREAVLCGCCLITGMRGAAGNEEDIPIDSKYKFDDNHLPISDIIYRIHEIMEHYDSHINDFNDYREKILNEKSEFIYGAISIFRDLE